MGPWWWHRWRWWCRCSVCLYVSVVVFVSVVLAVLVLTTTTSPLLRVVARSLSYASLVPLAALEVLKSFRGLSRSTSSSAAPPEDEAAVFSSS